MSGEYIFNFDPSAQIDPIIVHPGEYNSSFVSNKIQLTQASAVESTFSIFGDFTYRFVPGFQFNVTGSISNNGTYTVVESQYLPKTAIVTINGVSKSIVIAGDGTRIFTNGRIFTIQSSTYNNGRWMAKSSLFDGVVTTIQLLASTNGDAIPPSVNDGALIEPLFLDGFVETAITAVVVGQPVVNATNDGIIEYLVPSTEVGSSLTIPGRGAPTPGEHINRNLLALLSSFASTTAPLNPVSGQLWFDMVRLNVWDPSGPGWIALGSNHIYTDRLIVDPIAGSTLLTTPSYEVGAGVLSVYRNGSKLYPGHDYTEVSSGLVTMTNPTNTGEKFMFEVLKLD